MVVVVLAAWEMKKETTKAKTHSLLSPKSWFDVAVLQKQIHS